MATAKKLVKKVTKAPAKKSVKASATTKKTVAKKATSKKGLTGAKTVSKSAKKTTVKKSITKKTAPTPAKKTMTKKTVAKKATSKKGLTGAKAPAKKLAKTAPLAKQVKPVNALQPKKPNELKTQSSPQKITLPSKPAFDEQFLSEQKELLLKERQSHLSQAEDLKAEAQLIAQDAEVHDIQFDEESGEGDPLSIERERDQFLSAQEMHIVAEIDDALHKLERGTYGYCEICHKPIPKQRLRAMPFARLCVECKTGSLTRRV
jgi:DnaK suppressor protein